MELSILTSGTRRHILKGVARNAAAPERVLHRLMRTTWGATDIASRRQRVTLQLATALLETGNSEVAVALGRNRHLLAPIRWQLATHPDAEVRKAAVRRFALPVPQPGCEIPTTLLTHLADDTDPHVRSEVAAHDDTPDDVRTRLASDPDTDVRIAVAKWWTRPAPDVHRALLTDPEAGVRKAACSPWHPVPPADLHPALLADPTTRSLVAPHVRVTAERAMDLARDPDEDVRAAVAGNPGLPQAVCDELSREHSALVRFSLLVSRHTRDETRTRLYEEVVASAEEDDEWFIAEGLLSTAWMGHHLRWLRQAAVEEQLTLLDSPFPFLRYSLAACAGDLPQDTVERLLKDADPYVQKIAALYADSPPTTELVRIVWEHGDHLKISPGILGRPDFPAEAYERFATSQKPQLRAAAAAAPLSTDSLETLAGDNEPWVRAAAAGNPKLPLHCLPSLLADGQRNVAEEAGTSARLPVEWMEAVLTAEGIE
ncbi:hypothetical protein [Streptomyces yangpuensis]|uniref:HEAT repeat domain-containing protein n=1 Tax=Streptomyces yangpuensis TaxID=1648182 RepID=UPI00382BB0E0